MSLRSKYLAFGLQLADIASAIALSRFHSHTVSLKNDGAVVTDADCEIEKQMRQLISQRYPSHSVLGEEAGGCTNSARYQWLLDPIDGTASFVMGIPMFGTLIALLDEGNPQLGIVHLPVTQETLYAEAGHGCWYVRENASPKRVRVDDQVPAIEDATISLADLNNSEYRSGSVTKRLSLAQIVRNANRLEFIGGCIQHMLVAMGKLHASLDADMKPWDSAAIIPCVLEARGVVSTVDGEYQNVVFGGSLLCSCNRQLHETILRHITP